MWNPFPRADASVLRASDGERHEAIEKLVAGTTLRQGYYLLLTLSVVVVTLGLLVENAPIVIGGMVIAPVLTPILLLAVSAASRSVRGARHALTVLLSSVGITLALSTGITWVLAHATPIPTLVPSPIHPLIYAVIASCSGVVASIGWVKKEFSANVAGIAISVSLLPPLCTAGVGFALAQFDAAESAMRVFGTNVLGILGAAIGTFVLLGFARLGRVTEKTLAKEEKLKE